MIRFLLDSDVLMDFFKKKKPAVDLLVKLKKEGELTASILSVMELRAGWDKEQVAFFLPRFYELVDIKEVTKEVAELAGQLRREYSKKGRTLPVVDVLIAATAIINELQLVTRNRKDFPMSQLKFYPIQ